MTLYSDDHPEKSLKNTGYKNKTVALNTLKLIKNRSLYYQFTVVNTMYYRAKNHKNKTKEMNDAMDVFRIWLKSYPDKKQKESKLSINKINIISNKLDVNTLKLIKKYSNSLWRLKFIVYPNNTKYDYYSYLLQKNEK
jgi:hypothetical protein